MRKTQDKTQTEGHSPQNAKTILFQNYQDHQKQGNHLRNCYRPEEETDTNCKYVTQIKSWDRRKRD